MKDYPTKDPFGWAIEYDLKHNHPSLSVQTIYKAWIDFDETIKKLQKLDYYPKRHSAGRPKDGIQQQDAGNLTFTLKSGATISVSPKGQPHKIQVTWNNHGDKDKQFCELKNVLVPFEDKMLTIIPCFSVSLSYTDDRDEFLDKLLAEGLLREESEDERERRKEKGKV